MDSVGEQIRKLERRLKSLLAEETVMWDEVNAVERDLRFLQGNIKQQTSDSPYAAEDAAIAMMESAAKKLSTESIHWNTEQKKRRPFGRLFCT